jgi:hypothetical protein
MEDKDVDSLDVLLLAQAFGDDGALKDTPNDTPAAHAFEQLNALDVCREGRLERGAMLQWIDKELARCQRMQHIHRLMNRTGLSRGATANALKFYSLKEIDSLNARMNDLRSARSILLHEAPKAQQVHEDGSIARDVGDGLGGHEQSVGEKFGIADFPEGYRKPGFT